MSSNRSRRDVLRGLGALALSSPLVPLLNVNGAANTPVPRRLVLFFTPHGTIYDQWMPTGSETNFSLGPILSPLAPFKNKLVVIGGMRLNTASLRYMGGSPHPAGMGFLWTGSQLNYGTGTAPSGAVPADVWPMGPSVDQAIVANSAFATRYRSIELGVQSGGNSVGSRMIHSAPASPRSPVQDPAAAFRDYLSNINAPPGPVGGQPPVDAGTPPPRDAGTPPRDAGTPPRDAGVPPRDAGTPPRDAGTPPRDAGTPPRDAGTPPRDAGVPPRDAGIPPRDSGMMMEDAGVDPFTLRWEQRRSIIDFHKAELDLLLRDSNMLDRRKLEAHLAAIRELELSLEPPVSRRYLPPNPVYGTATCYKPQLGAAVNPGAIEQRVNLINNQASVLAAILACDLTRVASLQLSHTHDNVPYPTLNITNNHHNELTHLALPNYPATRDVQVAKRVKICTFFAEQFATLLRKLDAVPEGAGTMLDHTMVIWGTEMGDASDHGTNNTPFIVAGGGAYGVRTGRYLQTNGADHHRLLVSAMHYMGLTGTQSFGNLDAGRGPLSGLL